jgi:hypothetical protein
MTGRLRHVVSAALLLFVFFLPLHVHFFTSTPKVNNECSCVDGTRSQAGPVAGSVHWTPAFHATFSLFYQPQELGSISVRSYAIRAPPAFTSL